MTRRFGVSTKDGQIEAVWPQDVLKERFVGVSDDLNEFFLEEMDLNKRFPEEYRRSHERTVIRCLEFFKASLECRFDELNHPTGQMVGKVKSRDDKLSEGEL